MICPNFAEPTQVDTLVGGRNLPALLSMYIYTLSYVNRGIVIYGCW
jgi:hypothetical protein